MESFQELGLPAFLAESIKKMNFVKPTPVQAQAIPSALEGKDVIASAQTGTGKTAAFGIPLLAYLENNKDKMALIMTPTRELAVQVLDVLRQLTGTHYLGGSVLLIGGANMGVQLTALARKPRLIIGTPGRIIDHLKRGSLSLTQAGFLVLDEADRMLDMGFAPQLEEIRKRLAPERQTLLFSATIPQDIQEMGSRYLKNPVRITVGSTTQPVPKIAQMVVYTNEAKKPDELLGELEERKGSVLIFVRTQHRVDRVMSRLKEKGLKVTRIHGGRTQAQRKQAIDQFREGNYLILVATDIAARGLDIHHIAHVINYDLPRNPEDYIHRVGRTARAGAEGSALCFITPEDRELWGRITRLMGASKSTVVVKPSRFGDFSPKPSSPSIVNLGPQGHRPEGHRPEGQRPQGHRPQGHRPSGQRPQGGHPGHRPQGPQDRGFQKQGQHRRPDSGYNQGDREGRRDDRHGRPHRNEGHSGPRQDQGRSDRGNFIFHGNEGGRPRPGGGSERPKREGFFQKLGQKFSGGHKGAPAHRPFDGHQRSEPRRDAPPPSAGGAAERPDNFGNKEEMNRPKFSQEKFRQGQGGFGGGMQRPPVNRPGGFGQGSDRPRSPGFNTGGGRPHRGPGNRPGSSGPGGFKKPFHPKGPRREF